MESAPYTLLNTNLRPPPNDPGAYLQLGSSKKTDAEVQIKEQKWKSVDMTYLTFMNFRTATRQILKESILLMNFLGMLPPLHITLLDYSEDSPETYLQGEQENTPSKSKMRTGQEEKETKVHIQHVLTCPLDTRYAFLLLCCLLISKYALWP